ncbi:MAG: DUF2513 domain-containing protein [Erysipelotrichaceae bacterium]|nr:DUF2513 domain-containing protein [Erysipelotrichaceae bacterium]MBQ6493174.1 DUF2513 domain-containing protein [Erysipelotrichaceae bacterium]
MKRDMELCRKILFAIEKQYIDASIYNLKIEGYSPKEVSYNSGLLYEAGLISAYKSQNADDHLYSFAVGHLTWEGHDFLDKIREDTIWNKTKSIIKGKVLPMTLDIIKEVASAIISAAVQGAVKGIASSNIEITE